MKRKTENTAGVARLAPDKIDFLKGFKMDCKKRLTQETKQDPVIPHLGVYQKNPEMRYEKMRACICSMQHYSQSLRYGSDLCSHQRMDG